MAARCAAAGRATKPESGRFTSADLSVPHPRSMTRGLYQHELPGELSQAGNLLNEVIPVEAAGSGLGVDLRVGLRPGAWPVARQPDAGYTVRTALVHRALHRALEPPIDTRRHITGLDVHARPVIVGGCSRNSFHEPDIIVVDVHQARDHAAVLRALSGVCVLIAVRSDLDGLPPAHVLYPHRCDDRFQAIGVDGVIVELRPARFASRHEVAAVKVEDEGSLAHSSWKPIEIRHDAKHAQAPVIFDERHRVGVRGKQYLFVLWCAVIFSG